MREPGVILRDFGPMDGEGDVHPVSGFTECVEVLTGLGVKGEDFGCVGFDFVRFGGILPEEPYGGCVCGRGAG